MSLTDLGVFGRDKIIVGLVLLGLSGRQGLRSMSKPRTRGEGEMAVLARWRASKWKSSWSLDEKGILAHERNRDQH